MSDELGFSVERRPHGLRGDSQPWVVMADGFVRLASPEESLLWDALSLACARVVELEAQADAMTATTEEGRKRRRG